MKKTIVGFFLVLGFVISCPLDILAQTAPDKKAESEVIELINQWGRLWNENNQSALLDLYHPDAKITYGWGKQKKPPPRKSMKAYCLSVLRQTLH